MARVDKERDVNAVPFWWHTIDLGDGVITPGQTSGGVQQLRAAAIPGPLEGCTVLDVGCWDGFFTFWCESRGARVTAVDNFQYIDFVKSRYGVDLKGGEGFTTAARHLSSTATHMTVDFAQVDGRYDVVLFLGLLYHQRNPLLSLEHLYRLTGKVAVIETHYRNDQTGPWLRFYPGSDLNHDPTNYWGPTLSCVELMLRDVGFADVKLVDQYWDNDDRAIFLASR